MMTKLGRPVTRLACAFAALLGLAACQSTFDGKEDPLAQSVIDEADLNSLLLTAGDPAAAVTYFEQAVAREPERADFRQNLARAYGRVKRFPEAARVYQELVNLEQDRDADRLEYAFVNIRLQAFEDARRLAETLPQRMDTPRRHLLDGLLADHQEDWTTADASYARAVELSTRPAEIYNNWGVSKMSRGELEQAIRDFRQAISFDSRRFSAKNNLAIAKGLQGDYQLPIVPLTDTERAIIMNNLGLIALRKGDDRAARGLFASAVETHPQHYQGAADRLAALESKVTN
ncbi:MAG: tetratricopeptide repeat protein [Pseudomonadota bacterium]